MIYRRTTRFKKAFKGLPKTIKTKVAKALSLFQESSQHHSLGKTQSDSYTSRFRERVILETICGTDRSLDQHRPEG